MRTVSKEDVKATKAQLTLMLITVLPFVVVILAGVIALVLGSWFVFWALTIAGIIFIPKYILKYFIDKANGVYKTNAQNVVSSLESADYVYTDLHGAIGVDLNNKKISVLNTVNKKDAKPIVFNSNKIEEYGVTGEGYTEWDSIGKQSATEISEMARKNMMNRARAAEKTGVYFVLDDIHQAKLLAVMPSKNADQWIRLLKKFIDESLDLPEVSPMHFPVLEAE